VARFNYILKYLNRCKILVVGGGGGGTAVAAKLCFKYGAGSVVVLDPADVRKLKFSIKLFLLTLPYII
jgi:tRNA A37 threonylcarbamoyladenosine dehydratase